MTHDWLLVETLGAEPSVVAQGIRVKSFVPISTFLRRSPNRSAIQTAVAETVQTGAPLSSITPKRDRVIRTEPVRMSDGTVHGVQLWLGPADAVPPERPVPGPLVWDLTTGVATDTPESLANSGMDPGTESLHDRSFAEDLPTRDLNPSETRVLALAVDSRPGAQIADTWDVTARTGEIITVGFAARAGLEPTEDGSEHLLARAMNWRSEREAPATKRDNLAQRILNSLARPGTYRALIDLRTWKLLKWLDDPCPFYDWRHPETHPEDTRQRAAISEQFAQGDTAGRVIRLRGTDQEWVPVHVTLHRVELEPGVYAGLMVMREPTEDELAAR
ncbi:PAS domain-containing protein [Mycolicibacterium palauense]|uniref:PAS domain-containing protein n=1 Tax=Mycolicibacterium palauense TaxID=2034511 RepID=UPI000BFED49C|nr:PAS domain-containing protein [Mycolicibacterium palauense]